MATLEIDGVGKVEVDDAFLSLTPDKQAAEVDYIASQIRGGPPAPAPASGPPVYGPNDEVLQPQAPTAPEPRGVITRAVEGAKAGFGDGELGMSAKTRSENPAASSLQAVAAPADGLLRLLSATIGGGTGALAGLAEKAGLSPAAADRLQRDLNMIAQVSAVEVPSAAPAAASRVARAGAVADEIAATARPPAGATTAPAIKDAARGFYKEAENANVILKPESFKPLTEDIFSTSAKGGLDPTLTPDSVAAIKRLQEVADQPITFQTLDTLRQIASDAQGAVRASDRRIASGIVEKIDDYVAQLSAKDVATGDPRIAAEIIVKARDLWSKSAKLDTVSRLVDRAEISAPNFSGSGLENALRTEFRALAKNDRAMRTFTPAEQKAIKQIAKGTVQSNVARNVGKLAPSGVVSGALSGGGGAAIGTALGVGPVVGAAAATGAGFAARQLATAMTKRYVADLEKLIAAGGESNAAASSLKRGNSTLALLAAASAIGATADQDR